jgi:hypothetical protein
MTHKLLVDPFGAFRQKLEVRIGVNVENVDQLGLKQSANVHPLLVDLLNSKTGVWLHTTETFLDCRVTSFFF